MSAELTHWLVRIVGLVEGFCVGYFGPDIALKLWRKIGNRPNNSGDRSQAGAPPQPVNYGTSITRALLTLPSAGEVGARPRVVVDQEIIAERCWHLSCVDGGPILKSASHDVTWSDPTFTAHRIPTDRNGDTAGVYALQQLTGEYLRYPVVGTVALSGCVVEGENGYRAERATVRSLRLRYLPPNHPVYYWLGGEAPVPAPLVWKQRPWEVADQLAERYQCDVTIDWLPTSDLPATELTV